MVAATVGNGEKGITDGRKRRDKPSQLPLVMAKKALPTVGKGDAEFSITNFWGLSKRRLVNRAAWQRMQRRDEVAWRVVGSET